MTTEISELLTPAIEGLGLELVGIEFAANPGGSLLRIYIDEPERGVTIDDCERASREISALLDVSDPISGRYTLEVSSPGLDRPLFTPRHFSRFIDCEVKITVNLPLDGRRRFQGLIKAVDGDRIIIEQDGMAVELVHSNIVRAQLVPDFGALRVASAQQQDEIAERAHGRRSRMKA